MANNLQGVPEYFRRILFPEYRNRLAGVGYYPGYDLGLIGYDLPKQIPKTQIQAEGSIKDDFFCAAAEH